MPSSPGDKVQRQDQYDEAPNNIEFTRDNETLPDIEFMEDEAMEPGLVIPREVRTNQIVFQQWKVRVALAYLFATSALCLAAILIKPSGEVQAVALAVWGTASAVGGTLVRWARRR